MLQAAPFQRLRQRLMQRQLFCLYVFRNTQIMGTKRAFASHEVLLDTVFRGALIRTTSRLCVASALAS